ncbi:alpha/beta fold hydrolase [Pyxidicoccus trucidator]|uniref:alpha/beta fold hydrolase n=1 Tax=Pyxidicoccus trucidator TaxID=2709662 RepID=UPI0013D951ED|nr:alpha/beta hydrolase [Pyxidicoccus trucidator]
MIWVRSACPVGIRIAARLVNLTDVYLSAPRARVAEARAALISLLGHDPGERLQVQHEGLAPLRAGPGGSSLDEIWHVTYLGMNDRDDLVEHARGAGVTYRHFELEPVAAGPDALAPNAFSILLQALDETLQEVRSREPGYFGQRALQSTLPATVRFLSASSAANAILALRSAPPGRYRITASANSGPPSLGELIGGAYGVDLRLGAAPSALSAVDGLFELRTEAARNALVAAQSGAGAAAAGHVQVADVATSAELADLVSAWHRHHSGAHDAERARLTGLPGVPHLGVSRGGSTTFQVFGETGPYVVIVNAIAQDRGYWLRFIDQLARDHRVVIWQLRSLREDGQTAMLDDHVQELAAIIDEATDGPVHLIGWCTGPKLCARYYLEHPHSVASMVFLAGNYRPFGDSSLDTTYERALEKVFQLLSRSPSMAPLVRTTILDSLNAGRTQSDQRSDFGAEVLGRIDPSLMPYIMAPYTTNESTLQYAKQIREFWKCSIETDVREIRAPVLVIGAELDRIVSSRHGLRVANTLPNARFLELPGATHYCMHDRPGELASIIGRFIGEQTSDRPAPAAPKTASCGARP